MTDIEWDELGPKRRERDLEWLSKKISWLSWHLTRAHWARMPPGSHHLYMETAVFFLLPIHKKEDWILDALERERLHEKKVRRLIRQAKLHNRYLNQKCDILGMIIN